MTPSCGISCGSGVSGNFWALPLAEIYRVEKLQMEGRL